MDEFQSTTYTTAKMSVQGGKRYGETFTCQVVETEATVMANPLRKGFEMTIGTYNRVIWTGTKYKHTTKAEARAELAEWKAAQ